MEFSGKKNLLGSRIVFTGLFLLFLLFWKEMKMFIDYTLTYYILSP